MVQRFVLALLGVCLGASNLACVSAATYEHDLATARAEVRAVQQSASVQLDAMRTALMALQRSLTTEAELRATTVRMLEERLVRMDSQRGAPSSAPVGNLASNDLEFLRSELKKMHEQEQESSTRMRRIEEALQRLSNPGTKPIAAPDGDVKNPWGKLHAYPY